MNIIPPKLIFTLIILLYLFTFQTCSVIKCRKGEIHKDTTISKTAQKPSKPDTTKKTKETNIPVSEWTGKKFRLLEKPKMFQKFGYELYTSPLFSDDTTPADPNIELKNHRIKYLPFKGTNIMATAVKKMDNGEYLVTFKTDTLNLTIYGKTKSGIIEGPAIYGDFKSAEKRWMGKTIYSKRRCIEIFDSSASRFTSKKVSITEPLKVVSVRWGITPLPPKSLWLVVERPNGFRGLIPINYSWTNVLQTERTTELPWEKDILEKNPKEIYQWDDYIWETIDKHNIFTGMTTGQVRLSWGEPQNKHIKKTSDDKEIITYIYHGKTLKFENDSLTYTSE